MKIFKFIVNVAVTLCISFFVVSYCDKDKPNYNIEVDTTPIESIQDLLEMEPPQVRSDMDMIRINTDTNLIKKVSGLR